MREFGHGGGDETGLESLLGEAVVEDADGYEIDIRGADAGVIQRALRDAGDQRFNGPAGC